MGRTTEEVKLNEKTGWFIGRYHQWRKLLPNGKLSTAERAQLIHKDSWEYNHFRDKDGVIRKMSPNQQDQLLESLYYKEFERRQAEQDESNKLFEEPTTEAGRHTISETIKKFHEVRMPLLKDGTQKSYTRQLAYWESRIGDLTLEELNRKRLFEER